MKPVDSSAVGSDVARTSKQAFHRKMSAMLIHLFKLNKPTPFNTEFIQQLDPIYTVQTEFGSFKCRAGHGRLVWRARTFFEEEPQTVEWLSQLNPQDVLWDIGANVGIYSLYAGVCKKCQVYSFEPEAQNYATLLDNIVLNQAQSYIHAANIPISSRLSLGGLKVHSLTKGGAFNTFQSQSEEQITSTGGEKAKSTEIVQWQFGASVDELIESWGLPCPTHMKIDVDGNEPLIIQGAQKTLASPRCKEVLAELEEDTPSHQNAFKILTSVGFEVWKKRSNWESRKDKSRQHESPGVNYIFRKKA